MNVDWLIVGGGIHGTHIATRLVAESGVCTSKLAIIDPGKTLLESWRRNTKLTGMKHLRSPSVHHLDIDPMSLRRYANKQRTRMFGSFAPPYARPSLRLFNAHCDAVIERFEIDKCHIQDRAINCVVTQNGVTVTTSNGLEIHAGKLVLAMGSSEQPHIPDWAKQHDVRVQHVFAPSFSGWPSTKERVLVVGGGISAVQTALRLAKENQTVQLVTRHPLRKHQFDSDPGWLGPKFMCGFERERDWVRRRAIISDARHRGSVPPDVFRAFSRALSNKTIEWHQTHVESVECTSDGLAVSLSSGSVLPVDRILLATGFESRRPGGSMIDNLIETASLPVAPCGFPIVDTALRWHSHIHVSGPLAELELGPTSRNVSGARRAGDRLTAFLQEKRLAA